jgi:amino acid adenylation domain-containing protein
MIGVRVPRWVAEPVVGVGAVRVVVPDGLLGELRLVAAGIGVAPAAVLLAAHARVLAALTGEPRVTTGSVAEPGGPARPCVLSTDTGSWHSLVAVAGRPAVVPDAEFETVCDPHATGLAPVGAEVLRVGAALEPGRGALTVAYRTDVLDADAADRIAGYHLTALRLLAADPDADPTAGRLLSPAELRRQFDLLAGPTRPRPDRRVHELFEDRARRHPDAVAAVCGGRQIGYGTLNARANRLARALRARGIGTEDVVAVVTERNLDWLVAVLAVFKAGGAYLPIEPHFPADRVAAMLERAGCRLVVTEPGSDRCLPAAGPPRLLVGQAEREGHAGGDLDVPVAADQLAYIYFTSGSTGAPKGAMCEHAGMLNHLYAKIEDLGLDETAVVAQTAPQCFDISLWQLVAALLVGGRTVIVDQATILDVARFVDTVVASGVTVAQLVPSYLEVVLGLLAGQPRGLGALRCVSVTGEMVKKELVARWFAHTSGIALVNAYGLTETSDDTNHEVMHRVPDTDRVPLGRPVPNVRIYVVDERLDPVPLGAAGEIVFSGVCVGRGYVNDPERTAQAFRPDPHRPGQRLYRSGDHGRWLPDGRLEFLGRRDTQVKIRGFRIEIGEIDNALLRVPGVRDGAVVVVERPDRALVAFYTAPAPLPADTVRDRLAATLPAYMVPAAVHWRPTLPLTGNGKIDRRALTALGQQLAGTDTSSDTARTPTERRLAAAWSTVLDIPAAEIGRGDSFFDRGGSSLSAVKLVLTLNREVGLPDVIRNPTLAGLAALIDRSRREPSRSR